MRGQMKSTAETQLCFVFAESDIVITFNPIIITIIKHTSGLYYCQSKERERMGGRK